MSEERNTFKFYLMLLVGVQILFVIVDTQMVPPVFFDEVESVPVGNLQVHPYHFWIMGTLYFTMVFIISVTYYKSSGHKTGARVLFAIGLLYSLLMVEDILFFVFQREPIPETYTWLYRAPEISGKTVLNSALIGIVACAALSYWYIKKKRLD